MTDNYFKTFDQEGGKLKGTQMYTHTYTIQGKMFKIAYLNSLGFQLFMFLCVCGGGWCLVVIDYYLKNKMSY